jgi:CubicO group peptidase (beta-lactamase class C family)
MRTAILLVLAVPAVAAAGDPFPPATPESQGLAPKDLDALADVVAGFVRADAVVGAELRVIKDGHTVLHRGFGVKDRDKKEKMPTNAVYCVRSMTKPVVGVAIQMLADDGKLSIDDPIAKYLPAFDNGKSRAITIRQLLTHSGGLKLSTLVSIGLDKLTSLRELVDQVGENGPELTPGERFQYSDDGADTLTAVIGAVSGKPPEQFVQERILDPLGMADSICVLTKTDPRVPRVATSYAGSKGAWIKLYAPGDKPLFPCFLGSQGLYSTTGDYARFLKMIADGGTGAGKRLLSKEAVDRILTPARDSGMPTGFDDRTAGYGQFMILYQDKSKKVRAFGHNGSDGTHAYVIPEKGLMVLYFTQSRRNQTGVELETAVHRLLVEPGKPIASKAIDPKVVAPYLGLYWFDAVKCPVEVALRDGTLTVEFPWQAEVELKPTDKPERWAAKLSAAISIEFKRDGTDPAKAFLLTEAGASVEIPRLQPDPKLPSAGDVLARRAEKLGTEQLAKLGPVRIRGTVERQSTKKSGSVEVVFDGWARYRTDTTVGGRVESRAVDGETVWVVGGGRPPNRLDGLLAEQARLDHPTFAAADWKPLFEKIDVLRRFEAEQTTALLLRCVPKQTPARILVVEEATGRLIGDRHIAVIPGVGRVGRRVQYRDYKDVGGVQMPTKVTVADATVILGRTETTYTEFETKVELPAGAFAMPK